MSHTDPSRPAPKQPLIVTVAGTIFGGTGVPLIIGPCAAESLEQLLATARVLKACGVRFLRAGAYKPRTLPTSFQGLGDEGLELLAEVKRLTGLAIVTEVLSEKCIPRFAAVADLVQVGARNMQNFELLTALGIAGVPVLLKRGLAATVEEFLGASEYIRSAGNEQVILCERGFPAYPSATRATLDLAAIPRMKSESGLPVIVDPSHAAGRREYVLPLSLAATAAGADGLIVEAHPDPGSARSDNAQQLRLESVPAFVRDVNAVAATVGHRPGPSDDAGPTVLAW